MDKNDILVMSMSGIYSPEDFGKAGGIQACYLDETGLSGVDGYCDEQAQRRLIGDITKFGASGIHFIDNGNYHYISKLWLDQLKEACDLIVFDHHSDMQEPLFGPILSCGGWVKEVMDSNKMVRRVLLAGVNGSLVTQQMRKPYPQASFLTKEMLGKSGKQQLENGRTFLCSWYRQAESRLPVYISIDKDVLDERDYRTNWDQGNMRIEALKGLLAEIMQNHKVIGIDLCGELDARSAGDGGWREKNRETNASLADFIKFINNLEKN